MDRRMTFGGVRFGSKTQPLLSLIPINFDLGMNRIIMAQGNGYVNCLFGGNGIITP